MSEFFVRTRREGDAQGPFSAGQLQQLAAQGQLLPSHEVTKDGTKWHLAEKLNGLKWPTSQPAVSKSVSTPVARPPGPRVSTTDPLPQGDDSWIPSSDVTAHCGAPIGSDSRFFAPPPTAIGTIATASSTLKMSSPTEAMQFMVLGGCYCAFFTLFGWFGSSFRVSGLVTWAGVPIVGAFGCLLFFLWDHHVWRVGKMPLVRIGLRHRLTYVGQDGLAWFRRRQKAGSPETETILHFEDAKNMYAARTVHSVNGGYTGTSFEMEFEDDSGRSLFNIKGKTTGVTEADDEVGQFTDLYHFCESAEKTWSEFLFERLAVEFEERGIVEFQLSEKGRLRVGRGVLEVIVNGDKTRLTPEDIRGMGVSEGAFFIRSHDASWFKKKGKWSFPYDAIANARVFLVVIEQIGGFTLV
jgi:hypothetical protein